MGFIYAAVVADGRRDVHWVRRGPSSSHSNSNIHATIALDVVVADRRSMRYVRSLCRRDLWFYFLLLMVLRYKNRYRRCVVFSWFCCRRWTPPPSSSPPFPPRVQPVIVCFVGLSRQHSDVVHLCVEGAKVPVDRLWPAEALLLNLWELQQHAISELRR